MTVHQKGPITGTSADLRKLSMQDAKNLLMQYGLEAVYIDKMSRWQRIDAVRKCSTAVAAEGGAFGWEMKRERGKGNCCVHMLNGFDEGSVPEAMLYRLAKAGLWIQIVHAYVVLQVSHALHYIVHTTHPLMPHTL